MFVKPGPNPEKPGTLLKVRIPRTHALLKEEGEEVPENMFWLWMLNHGDVVMADPPSPAPAPEVAAATGEHPAEGH